MRYLFFVLVILCTSGMASRSIATPIVVDYSEIPKVTFKPSLVTKPTDSDNLLSQKVPNNLITQQSKDATPPTSIGTSAKEFQANDDFRASNELLPTTLNADNSLLSKNPQEDKEALIRLGFNFNGFHQTNTLEENSQLQQPNQSNRNHASLNLKNILRDTIKDNEVLMELAEGTVEVYRSFNEPSAGGGFQSTSSTASFGHENYGASRDFLDAPPLIAAQQQAPTSRRSWGEETFFDKLIQFCFSWKGLLTLCGFLIFNSILFKLV